MIEVLIVYLGILWLVFKKFKLIPINTWTMVGAFLVGAFTMVFMLILLNMYQPITDDSRFIAATTPIVSEVRGKVIEVPVKSNVPLKKGDVLLRIDPAPFRHKLAAVEAQLGLAGTRLKQETELVAKGAGNQYEVQRYDADVKRLTSELDQAKIDLENTTVRAPADGYVTQVSLRPGQMAVPMPLSPLMIFVHAEDARFVAAFRQNSMQGIDPGDEVEVSLDGVPGRVFAAKVRQIVPMMAEGQMSATGTLRSLDVAARDPGRVLIEVEFTDDMSSYKLPAGASGTTTVYTGQAKVIKVLRMILLRTKAWEKYLFAS